MTRAGTARHGARRDSNEPDIITALVEAGCIVETLSKKGVPDLLVWSPFQTRIILIEVKDPGASKKKRDLNEHQAAFHSRWRSVGAPVYKVSSIDGALIAAGALDARFDDDTQESGT